MEVSTHRNACDTMKTKNYSISYKLTAVDLSSYRMFINCLYETKITNQISIDCVQMSNKCPPRIVAQLKAQNSQKLNKHPGVYLSKHGSLRRISEETVRLTDASGIPINPSSFRFFVTQLSTSKQEMLMTILIPETISV